ncbi:helix-turn-helix domain-containing protein [Alkalihalobacillus trypoxylicola]|uniref:HTH cro/C1-type domain-containing protein n=1 Tax=Alkalihalobacillus trypoxylicola TaxID=519424 RepID=A0A162EIN0_9BACI|nr:helix-turn-helix transcriptional regulator [Alkalihalobacillus trypoxylicola]KYG32997.1 hypothetical protein AZF04_17695 [Alkalihalobacillus trypoxylicola]GAF66669.1 putative transcriptional regulator [Bacillus sp. TS-2]
MNIGERVKHLREERGWSQKELAQKMKINNSVLNRIENNKRVLTDSEIIILAKLFQISTDDLLGLEPKQRIKEENKLYDITINKEELHLLKDYLDFIRYKKKN